MSFWDDDAGYDLDDPKHPTFAERAFAHADQMRKEAKESDLSLRPREGEQPDETLRRVVKAVKRLDAPLPDPPPGHPWSPDHVEDGT